MPSRPAIPAEVAREVLTETGHRCAVCGTSAPLERAHIIPWSKSKDHQVADLLCLCANCHERADLEKWGEKTLRDYKRRPWIMRQNERADGPVVPENGQGKKGSQAMADKKGETGKTGPAKRPAVGRSGPSTAARGRTGTTSRATPMELTDTPPPVPLYVIFCRLCGLEGLTARQQAVSQQVLITVCEKLQQAGNGAVFHLTSSAYGRILYVEKLDAVLQIASQVLDRCATQGVALTIGVTMGRLTWESDLGPRKNLMGHAVNLAARQTAIKRGLMKIVVCPEVRDLAVEKSLLPASKFSIRKNEQVKKTAFDYHILKHSHAKVGKLREVKVGQEHVAHVVAYDLAGFSSKESEEAGQAVTGLRKRVNQVLVDHGCRDKVERDELWYSPGGDGGILVFRNDPGAAWALAQAVLLSCGSKIQIRVGIAMGIVVVVDGQLPVGSGILRADKLSSYPASGRMCVDNKFWLLVNPESQAGWKPVNHGNDAEARLLQKEGEPPVQPAPPSGVQRTDVNDIFGVLIATLSRIFHKNERLRQSLEEGLRSKDPHRLGTSRDIVEMTAQLGLNQILVWLYNWVRKSELNKKDIKDLGGVVEALAPLGVAPDWVKSMRLQLEKGILEVSEEIRESSVPMIVAALYDLPTKMNSRGKASLAYPGYVASSTLLEPTGTTSDAILECAKANLIKFTGILEGKANVSSDVAAKILRDHLLGLRLVGKPVATLLEKNSPLAKLIRDDQSFDWRLLLVMQTKEGTPSPISEPHTTTVLLKTIIDHLRELENQTDSDGQQLRE